MSPHLSGSVRLIAIVCLRAQVQPVGRLISALLLSPATPATSGTAEPPLAGAMRRKRRALELKAVTREEVAGAKIVLVDRHEEVAEEVRLLLQNADDLAVVGVARNGDTGLRVMRGDGPDVLVLDLRSSHEDLAKVIAETRAAAPNSRILMLSTVERTRSIQADAGAGADLDALGDRSDEELVASTRGCVDGCNVVVSCKPPEPPYRREPEIELLVSTLSRRERDVLRLVTAGYSNQRIAETCFLSMHTVRTHVQSILVKLGVHSKLEAAIFAIQHHLVQIGGET
jgi:two-component system, NarL family, response regulator LiaR